MHTVPIDLKLPIGVVGYVLIDRPKDVRRCAFDSSQIVTERSRNDARSIVRAGGGECSTCTVTCPFQLN